MMNESSAASGDADNLYDRDERNLNMNNITTVVEKIELSQSRTGYSEKYRSNSFMFEGFNDNDDEVFEEFQESSAVRMRVPRVRRISDVIDSIGCSPSSPVSRTSNNFDFSETQTTECMEERSISIIRREEVKYIELQSPPRGRGVCSVTDSLTSPPGTPSSDQGYCSTGLPTPPANLVFYPKGFRYSSSSCEPSSPPKLQTLVDAQVMCAPSDEKMPMEATTTSPTSGGGVTPLQYPKATMPVSLQSMDYNMTHARTGHAVIFNHEEFQAENTPARVGSKLDAIRLKETLEGVGFEVVIYHDLDSEKIKMRINELATQDHSDCDCVLVAVLSHGMGTSYILSHDYPYPVDMLWTPFIPDRCPTLAGKPKLFLIQACRGDRLDGGVHLVQRTQVDSDAAQTYKIPAMADFLIAYSTAEGFYSWRNPMKGTWFIQSLCDVLDKEAFDHDLNTLLTMVGHRVALEHESFSDIYPWQHQQKQVPQTVSTLIRRLVFQRKK